MRLSAPARHRAIAALLLLGAGALTAHGARSIVVAPTAVYMDHQTRSAEITLYNPSEVAEEVVIEAIFGYPATDADGRLHLHVDAEGADPRSAAGWLRAFPDRVVVPPGGRQVVRVFGDPPSDLPDGEYWARMVITARGQSVPIQATGGADIRVGVDLEVRTLIAATYRKGPVSSGLEVEGLGARVEDGALVLRPALRRTGNGAWIGSLRLRILDASGTERQSLSEQIAVYRDYHRRFTYPLDGLPPGSYVVEAVFSSDRDDVPARYRIPSASVSRSATFTLP
jgi:hypothetical protein